ncbi:MAG: PASTA domain-containing protein [Friedmanniella sp.]
MLKALAKQPDERYQSAAEMKADLGVLLTRVDGYLGPAPAPAGAQLLAPPPPVAATATQPRALALAAPVASEPPDRRGTALRALVIAASAFLLLGLGAFALYRLLGPAGTSAASVQVPDVVGRTRAEADTRLRNADLVPRFTDVDGKAGKSVDRVVKQSPGGGGSIPPGSVITLEVNTGPATARIPDDLVGQDLADAEQALAAAGFTDVSSEAQQDGAGDAPAGSVLSVDPHEGTSVTLDEDIVLRYAHRTASSSSGTARRPRSDSPAGSGPARTPAPTRAAQPTTPGTTTAKPTPSSSPTPTASAGPTNGSKPTATTGPSASTAPTTSSRPGDNRTPSQQPKVTPSPRPSTSG